MLRSCFFLILIFSTTNLISQMEFKMDLLSFKVKNSYYNHITLIDKRQDKSTIGFVQAGAFNKRTLVFSNTPLEKQLEWAFKSIIDSTAKNGEMLLELNQFNISELTKALSEKGFLKLKMTLYAKDESQYRILNNLDTLIVIKGLDVSEDLMTTAQRFIPFYISKYLKRAPITADTFLHNEILNSDSLYKSKHKIYSTKEFTDGIYYTFETFANQTPDAKGILKFNSQMELESVKIMENNKPIKVKSKEIYAVVEKGMPYIANELGYYRLFQNLNDFYFVGKAKVSPKNSDVLTATILFGLIGALAASQDSEATFYMKLDPKDGSFIQLQKLKTPPSSR